MGDKLSERNHGIDLLRIVSMMAVIVLHVMGHGGILSSATGLNSCVAWFMEIVAMPAVNCFVLISGFIGYRNDQYAHKPKNIISLWFLVSFYSFGITLLFKLLQLSEISITDLIEAAMPITTGQYWFFTAYFVLFIFSPLLNCFVHNTGKRSACVASLLIALIMSLYPTIYSSQLTGFGDPFKLQEGYSFVWFGALYFLGAVIKKYRIHQYISSVKLICYTIGLYVVTWTVKVFWGPSYPLLGNAVVGYLSPTILLISLALLCLFAKLQPGKIFCKIISFFAPVTFAVYLIHDNRKFRQYIISSRFSFAVELNPALMVLIVIAVVITVFVVCSCIDKIRLLLFRLLKIDWLSKKIVAAGGRLTDFILKKSNFWDDCNNH